VRQPRTPQTLRSFRLDWKRKAAAFRLFNAVPAGQHLYYLTQRYVTRTIPRNLADHGRWQFEHARTFRRAFRGEPGKARLFEFGAGWDLHSSLVQWCYGINDQVVVDISRLVRLSLVNLVIDHLRKEPPPEAGRVPERLITEPLEESLRRFYGIRYLAPADARRTDLESGSVDLVCTTSVLEHIPAGVLAEILEECHRICSDRGIMSHVIDYTDHYAHSDPSISIYNFLKFSDSEWAKYNPAIHYQNRLRHFEYGQLFAASGFVTLAETSLQPDDAADLVARVPLSGRFREMSLEQLVPRTGHWVLARR
jgi:hypothetical protein